MTGAARSAAQTWGRAVVFLRWPIVVGWLLIGGIAVALTPSGGGGGGGLGGLVPSDSQAVQTEIRSFEEFGLPLLSRTQVVQRDPKGLSIFAQGRAVLRALNLTRSLYPDLKQIAGALPITNTLRLFPSSRERGTTSITYLFFRPSVDASHRERAARRFVREVVDERTDSAVGITGVVPGRIAQGRLIKSNLSRVEVATVLLVALIVAVHFRTPVAAIVTLLAAGTSYVVAMRLLSSAAQSFGLALPEELEPLIVVLLLGIITDYSIFYLSSMRRSLSEGRMRLEAARATARSLTPIIVAAGLLVAGGTGALVVARIESFRALGPGMALTVLVGVVITTTFIPAVLAILGSYVFWPTRVGGAERRQQRAERRQQRAERRERTLERRGEITYRLASRRFAIIVAVVTTLLLAISATGITQVGLGFSIIRGLPDDHEVRRAAVAASEGFSPGIVSPTELLLIEQGITERRRALRRLQRLIEDHDGVAGVVGVREVVQLARFARRLQETQQPLGETDPAEFVERFALSEGGDAARFLVILDSPPLRAPAIEKLRSLRRTLPDYAAEAGLGSPEIGIAGDTAVARETISQTVGDLQRIAIAVSVVTIVLLGVFLRSLVAPFFLLAASFLGFLAGLGLTGFFSRYVLDSVTLSFFVPFASAVLLISLGSDYNIFLVGRIWSEARHMSLREALAIAAPRASRTIAVAGVTLGLSFAMLALVPLQPFRQIAVALSAGVLIDTFVVRSFLVPALIVIVGPVSAWPGRTGPRPRIYPMGSKQWRRENPLVGDEMGSE